MDLESATQKRLRNVELAARDALIGGNHLASTLVHWGVLKKVSKDTPAEEALEILGAGPEYDVFVAWQRLHWLSDAVGR